MSAATKIIYHEAWRSAVWEEDIPSRPGWQVQCSECGLLKENWAYAKSGDANAVATRHLQRWHGAPKRGRSEAAHDTGFRDGAHALAEEIRYAFSGEPGTPQSMGELLEFFRMITGDPELQWPT